MTLDKHEIQGVQRIGSKVLPISVFEELVIEAGYYKTATAPSFGTIGKNTHEYNYLYFYY